VNKKINMFFKNKIQPLNNWSKCNQSSVVYSPPAFQPKLRSLKSNPVVLVSLTFIAAALY
ncbi:hypothetical protein C7E22_16690, partial [Vibrio sp. V02_P2A34T13]